MKKNLNWIKYKLFYEKRSPIQDREPWLGNTTLKWLKRINIKNFRVLEYGGGGSTLYFSDNAKEINTIETNHDWQELIKNNLIKNNVKFINKPFRQYDLILIDSSNNRINELIEAKKHVKSKGIIIFDNIERYPNLKKEFDLIQTGICKNYAGITSTGIKFS